MTRERWSTALVTGASSGIGREFARALAVRGCDLVIVARRHDRLESLASELRSDHQVDVEVMAADLTERDDLAEVETRLRDVAPPIDLLVNNAGMATYGPFLEIDVEDEDTEIRLNVLAVARLAHVALPGMVERGSGAIVNVSSLAGMQPVPFNTTYAATKAFVSSFSESLHEELRGTGVRVMALCPGFVKTEFHDAAEIEAGAIPAAAWLDADDVVATALRDLERGEAVSVPGLGYRTLAAASRVTPRPVVRRVVGEVMRRM